MGSNVSQTARARVSSSHQELISRDEMAVAGEDVGDDPGMDWQAEYLKKLGQDVGDLRTDIRRLDDRLSASLERLSTEVAELRSVAVTRMEFNLRVDEMKTELIGRMDRQEDKLIGRMDQQRDELIGQMGRQKEELIGRIDHQKDELIKRMGQQQDELIGRMDQQRDELIGRMDQQRDELIGGMDQQKEELIGRMEQQKSELINRMEHQVSILNLKIDNLADKAHQQNLTISTEIDHFKVRMDHFEARMDRFETRMDHFGVELGALRRETHTIIRWVIGTMVTMFIGFATVIMKLMAS